MMRIPKFVVGALALGGAVFAQAQGEVTLKATEVVPGITRLSGEGGFFGGNLGLITGDDGVILR